MTLLLVEDLREQAAAGPVLPGGDLAGAARKAPDADPGWRIINIIIIITIILAEQRSSTDIGPVPGPSLFSVVSFAFLVFLVASLFWRPSFLLPGYYYDYYYYIILYCII